MITVFGAGAFGTALAVSLARNDDPVALWTRDPNHADEMQSSRVNTRRLPGIRLQESIKVFSDVVDMEANDICLLAIPMQQLRSILDIYSTQLDNRPLVACCKGIELSTGKGPTQILEEMLPNSTSAILTGPSFADDIASGLPTALTLACRCNNTSKSLQLSLTTPNLRIYRTSDTIGAELGGALKNVMAIACGAVMGAGLGESARAALMTRGYAEMQRMAKHLGARPETLAGLSGFGDLALTCTSDLSRNYRFGQSLGLNEDFDSSITVEGAATARAVVELANEQKVEMPISQAVVELLDGKVNVLQAVDMLLSRPLKEE